MLSAIELQQLYCNTMHKLPRPAASIEPVKSVPLSGLSLASLQVDVAVEQVMEDIKTKYEEAIKELEEADQSGRKALSDHEILKAAQTAKMDEIKGLCV